ncbi:MAG: DUF2235 domain-containing protein [Blastocatellia bacterium]|nr:DUF2235 domain-containing protein [Blastocatellia bacterium]
MKRIVLCFDGTWNRPADEKLPETQQVETNVRRFYEAVSAFGADGVAQAKWYDEGVGTRWYDRFIGGAIGVGLDQNIRQGYRYLAQTYQDGDEVYILGFSRGAYTARSLVGLIRNCGLLKRSRLNLLNIGMAYGIYRTRDDGPDSLTARLFRGRFSQEISIKFLGVWDTVGALGVPLDVMQNFNLKFYEFHDTQLSRIVKNACHAVAVDEHRKAYDVCLWTPTEKAQQSLEQRWFIGAHSNVGGGYANRQLSDLPLNWMMSKATALGLGLNSFPIGAQNHLAPIADSYADFLNGRYAKLNPRYFRAIGTTQFGNEIIDETVKQRRRDVAQYQPANPGLG